MDFNLEKQKPVWPQVYKYRAFFLMLLPILAWYFIFSYVPIGGILIAFQDFNPMKGIFGSPWAGLKWFKYLFSAADFGRALRNTLLINLYMLVFAFPTPIILALLLNECRSVVFKKVVQTVSYLPHFISWSITAGFLVTLLSPSLGIVNQFLKLLGADPVYFLAEPSYTRSILVVSSIWKGIGWGSILYLAALAGINPELYEAARLDGASKWRQVWHITLPGISYIIVMQLIFTITSFIDVGFEQVYNIVTPATYETGMVISNFVYTMGIKNGQFSFSTAVGLSQSIVGMLLLIGANTIAKRYMAEGAIW